MKKPLAIVVLFVFICGYFSCTKDTAIVPAAPPVCDSTHVSYSKSIVPIINANCAIGGCHGSPLGASAVDLTVYANVKNEVADDVDNNSILCRLQGTTCGPQMPLYGRPLNAAYIDTFELWKSGGYCN